MLSVGAWAQTTLQEQINSTTDGSTVQLTEDYAGQIVVPATSNLILDLNSHKIGNDKTTIINNGKLTIKDTGSNGKIVSTGNVGVAVGNNSTTTIESCIIESVEGAVITSTSTGATIIIKGGTFNASDNAVIAGNGSANYKGTSTPRETPNTITINGGTFNGQIKSAGYVACGIYSPWKDVITVNGGTFNITGGCGVLARAGSVTINGGEFNCTGTATGKVGDSRVVVPCSAVVYDSQAGYPAMTAESKIEVPTESTAKFTADSSVAAVSVVGDSHIKISGGSYSSPLAENVCADGYVPSNIKGADGTYGAVAGSYVAQIGEKKYTSLISAINDATADQTIGLLSDVTVSTIDEITINKKLTLDLAGYTITSTVKEPIDIKNSGDLTITGNGKIVGPTGEAGKLLDGHAIITVEGGKLTYLNGTLTCGGVGSDGMYGVYILNGGTAVFGEESTQTGPTITSWFAAIGENNTTAPANVIVYGGTYTAQANPTESDWWHYFCAPIYAAGSGEINIQGGEFKGYYGLSSRYSNVNQDLNISGGTFIGTKSALFVDNQSGVASSDTRDIAVSGGTFSSAVLAEYCANGYVPTSDGKGNYGVKHGDYVAQIGVDKYASLAEAVNAAEANATVILLTDVTLDARVEPNKNMEIDLNGHTIKSTATCGNGSAFDVKGGNVVIKNGTIDGTQVTEIECDAITARSGANVTLQELNIIVNTKNGACAYAFDGSKIIIESGHYENQTTEPYEHKDGITAMVVNQANVTTQLIEIKGGTFKGYDPAMGDDSQISNENFTFIASGFYTEKNADGSYELKDKYVVTDGENFKKLVKPVTVMSAAYTRSMPDDTKFGTVCVPFSLTQGDGTTAPKLYTFGSIAGSTLTINEVTENVEPGTPVIFYIEGGEAKFKTTDASVNTKDLTASSANLVGTYSSIKIEDGLESIYYINGDQFHQAKASLTVPAYRAYIKNTSAGAKPRVLSIVVDEEATAIESLDANAEILAIYDASGRQLTAPKKGLNIMKLSNGKTAKLFVK